MANNIDEIRTFASVVKSNSKLHNAMPTKRKPASSKETSKEENLRDLILKEIEELEINQSQLSERVGVRPTTISAWLRGAQYPDEENRKKLATALGYTLSKLDSILTGQVIEEKQISIAEVKQFIKLCNPSQFREILDVVHLRVEQFIV